MGSKQSLSIILPVYNEEKGIKNLVTEIIANIKSYIDEFEIILVNDGSKDNTAEVIKNLALKYSHLRIINNDKNKGYGAAIRVGIYNAKKDWSLIIDADGQYEINDLRSFWDKKSYYDFIIGYRKKRSDNFYRKLLAKIGNLTANLFLKTNVFIKDIDCGFKLFKTRELKTIPIKSNGIIISFEILCKLLQRNKLLFVQLPIIHYSRTDGKSTGGKFNTIIKIVLEFFKIILK